MKGNEGICLSDLGFPERVERYREVQQAREKWGKGGETWMGKTEGNYITLDLSNSFERNRQGQFT